MPNIQEIDLVIAEKIFKWERVELPDDWRILCYLPHPLNYSTKITDAWRVVEQLFKQDRFLVLLYQPAIAQWEAKFHGYSIEDPSYSALGETAPLAICHAALKAIGYEIK